MEKDYQTGTARVGTGRTTPKSSTPADTTGSIDGNEGLPTWGCRMPFKWL